MKKLMMSTLLIATLGLCYSVQAAQEQMMMPEQENNRTTVTKEYIKAMDDMHKPMMNGIMDSEPDVAFVKGMIAHHQGAIDMAKIELKYGKDVKLRKLAKTIIEDQEKEILFMKNWLNNYENSSLTVDK
ncbi:MAG: DUF305 domain-containing protein [Candidatus Schmidhempelia sp.]|nr:DUF305 domain-containing protein [Candidatus Schmidhempelia sp.]